MTHLRILGTALVLVVLCASIGMAETKITVAISGPGAVNETTIKAGEPVSVDIYWENGDEDRRGFTTGFQMTSETIKTIVHVPDSNFVIADSAAVRLAAQQQDSTTEDIGLAVGDTVWTLAEAYAHNGWDGFSAWDFTGLRTVPNDWDGNLPDLIGFGGLRVKNVYNAHENKKVLSWTIVVPEAGMITIDSSFYSPGGIWAIVGPDGVEILPAWGGPYTFEVVE